MAAATEKVSVAVTAPAPAPAPAAAPAPAEAVKADEGEAVKTAAGGAAESSPRSASFKEESYFVSDLKEAERKALQDLKARIAEAIKNSEFTEAAPPKPETETVKDDAAAKKADAKEAEAAVIVEDKATVAADEVPPKTIETVKETLVSTAPTVPVVEAATADKPKQPEAVTAPAPASKQKGEGEGEGGVVEEVIAEVKEGVAEDAGKGDVYIWGVPLRPSKADERTDVVLLKFLRARDFKVKEAFTMLRDTILWRKRFGADTILDEDLGNEFEGVAYMHGYDKEGHPVCYNVYGVFQNKELYQKTFADEAKRDKFLRWRVQLLEKGIRQLSFSPGGISSMVQITDLKNSPGPEKKELRQALALLQDNYPEFVAKKIFINVPWWYLALYTMISPFITQRTKSKFVVARPSRVAETLFRYISPEHVPVQYGGLSRENDTEFSAAEGGVTELIIKAGAKHSVEIPVAEIGTTLVWDLVALGWEVSYGAEFVPSAESGYTVIIQKTKKFLDHEEPVRNSFKIGEQGKVVLTIENVSSRRKKVLYRSKVKTGNPA